MAKIKMKNSVTVAETFHDFLMAKKAAGISEKTLLTYGQHFSAVSKHLSLDTPMNALNKADLEAMIASMRDAGLAANSIKSYTRTLKSFLSWCNKAGITRLNIQLYKAEETIKETYSDEELKKLLKKPNMKKCTFAEYRNWVINNLGLKAVPIDESYPAQYDRLLCGGIWCIVQLDYEYVEEDRNGIPISIRKLTPVQMPHIDIAELKQGRRAFSKEEWMDVMLRSIGMEPDTLRIREKWLLLARMLPLVENNFNLCELGLGSTGKSHLYKEISPNSILVSGGQTTVANLFYNMGRKAVGLVGLWDCVAFDEAAGIRFKDKDGIQIMKDYMASGSFARGKEEKAGRNGIL